MRALSPSLKMSVPRSAARGGYGASYGAFKREKAGRSAATAPSPHSPDAPNRAEAGNEIDRLGADPDRLGDGVSARIDSRHGAVRSVCDPYRVRADGDCGGRVADFDELRGATGCRIDSDDGVSVGIGQPDATAARVDCLGCEREADARDG